MKFLLDKIRDHWQNYFSDQEEKREVNYEDLFFGIGQLEDHLLHEYENPAIEPFVKSFICDLPAVSGREGPRELATLACNYIRDVITLELSKEPTPPNHLTCLVDAMRHSAFEGCDVFTLNHDLLIEKVLKKEGVPFADGFGMPDGDVAWWKPSIFNKRKPHRLLKLHGSIDWFDYSDERPAKALTDDWPHAYNGNGNDLGVPDRPKMLVGTFNKIRDYS